MKKLSLIACLVAVSLATVYSIVGLREPTKDAVVVSSPMETPVDSDKESLPRDVVSFQHVLNLTSESMATVNRSIDEIERGWHPGTAVMLVEVARFARSRRAFTETLAVLKRKTDQEFGQDFDSWYRWIWLRKYDPHPQYAQFKSGLYSRIDNRFSEYFEQTANARIRLDEIRWGGVVRDGIPPLKNPKMIPAEQATYLADSNVVFGVNLNGDARCYPKRILAWHEMFKDTIGTVSVCGAY